VSLVDNNVYEKDLLTIGEFSAIVGISVRSLRNYDNDGVLPAYKHGNKYSDGRGKEIDGDTEHDNKYRYYSPAQITSAKMQRVFTDIGVKQQTIKDLVTDRSPPTLVKLLKERLSKVLHELHFLEGVKSAIVSYLDLLYEGISAMEDKILYVELPEKPIVLGAENNHTGASGFYRELMRFCDSHTTPRLNLACPMGGYFDDMEKFKAHPSQPTRFFSIDLAGEEKIETGMYLVGYARGYYGKVGDLPERIVAYAKSQGLEFSGPVYVTFPFDEMCITDKNDYLAQVFVPVRETNRTPSRRPGSIGQMNMS